MPDKSEFDLSAAHKKFSSQFFNQTWDLLDKPDRSKEENERMVHLAHASLCHWLEREDCSDQNLSIGTWQLSRVYSVVGETENSIKYAEICLEYSQKDDVDKVYLGYAYEALARALKVKGDINQSEKFLSKANEIAGRLEKEDRQQLEADLATI